jgi:hypothetical protein
MDIDIDFKSDFDPLDYFDEAVRASMVKNGEIKKHPVGAYFQNMPKDKVSGLAAIPYEQAEELGYFKIDFLHLSILDNFENKDEIRALVKIEPDWSLLRDEEVVSKLFQIHKHFKVLNIVKPTSVQELADCIALIRPSKRLLMNKYKEAKTENEKANVRKILYTRPEDGSMWFKKAHSVAYSLTIVLQLHLIKGGII